MGTVETRSKTLASSSIRPPPEPAKPQVSGEKNLREVLDGKKESRVGLGSTPEGRVRVNQENGVKESLNGKQGLDDDDDDDGGSRVVQTEISSSEEVGLLESSLPRKRESARGLRGRHGAGRTRSVENADEVHGAKPGIGEKIWLEGNGISLNENRKKEPYGKLRTIEVPIAETSENNDGEVEDTNEEGHEFSVGDFVWGKVKSHPWWPGQIFDPSYASDYAAKIKPKDRLLVAYFGDGTFAWCQPSQLKPFEENFVEMSKQSSSKVFLNAVQQAVDEIGRLLELKMTCSCVPKENYGLSQPSVVNSGIKEGVIVPEGGIGKLSAVTFEPEELLAGLKRTAQIIYVTSVLELRVMQSWLSAFYRSKGGYKLPQYHEPQPTPGLEEDDWKSVEVPFQGPFEDWLSSPVGASLAQNSQSWLENSTGNSESRMYHRRKQKSIADIMERDKDSQAKTKDKKFTEEGNKNSQAKTKSKEISEAAITGKQTTLSGKKKRKGREESDGEGDSNLTSETGRGRKARFSGSPISADINTTRTDKKNVSVVKEETKKGLISRRRKNDAVSSENVDEEGKIRTGERSVSNSGKLKSQSSQRDDSEIKGQTEKGLFSRERKKSKYLSPPFTNINSGKRKREMETESMLGSNEAGIGERMTKAADQLIGSHQIVSCSTEKHLKNLSIEQPGFDQETSHGSSPKTKIHDQKEIVDPTKANVAVNEVLSQIWSVAVNPFNLRGKTSFEVVVGFMSIFRNSIYRNGSNYKRYNVRQPRSKRKILDSESELLGNDPNQPLNQTPKASPKNESERRRTRKNEDKKADKLEQKEATDTLNAKLRRRARKNEDKKADMHEQKEAMETLDAKLDRQKPKQAGGTPDSKEKLKQGGGTLDLKTKDKKTEVEASPAVLFVTFGPGSSYLPTKADLIRIYSEYGDLDETETEMFYNNFCARVSFIYRSDAEKAFSHSQNANPFGSANVTFRLRYLSGASKTRELSEISSKKASSLLKPRDDTPKKKSTSQTSVEASELNFIKQKLEKMTSMLENSDKKISPTTKSKLEGEMKGLLEKVNTMVTSSSKIG